MTDGALTARKAMRLKGYDYSRPGYYSVTVCTQVRQENTLCRIAPAGGGLRAAPLSRLTELGQFVDSAIHQIPAMNPGVEVDIDTVMPDHVHMVLNLTGRHGGRPQPGIIGRFKT